MKAPSNYPLNRCIKCTLIQKFIGEVPVVEFKWVSNSFDVATKRVKHYGYYICIDCFNNPRYYHIKASYLENKRLYDEWSSNIDRVRAKLTEKENRKKKLLVPNHVIVNLLKIQNIPVTDETIQVKRLQIKVKRKIKQLKTNNS